MSWIYCLTENGNKFRCKIGVCADLSKRRSALQGGNWRKLSFAWKVEIKSRAVALSAEQNLLLKFRPNPYDIKQTPRLYSEWIESSPLAAFEYFNEIWPALGES